MASPFTYPGATFLNAVRASIDDIDPLAFAETIQAVDRLDAACAAGLSLEQTREATGLFIATVQQILEDAQSAARIDLAWAERMVKELESHWYARIPLLPAGQSYEAYSVVDILYGCWTVKRSDAVAYRRAEEVVRQLPIPAPHTADALLVCAFGVDPVTETSLLCADVVASAGSDPAAMLRLAMWRSTLEFQYAEACRRFSGDDLKALRGLWSLNQQLTRQLGADYAFQKIGFFGSSQKKLEAQEQQLAWMKTLREASMFTPSDGWVSLLQKFIQARVDAGMNDVKAGRKAFKKLFEAGFAPHNTATYLAMIHNFLKDPADARQVLEAMAEQVPYLQGDLAAGGTLGETYAEAGGDPADLGLSSMPARITVQCKQNEEGRRRQSEPKLAALGARAIAEFWSAREATLQKYVAKAFSGEHFDAALGHGAPRPFQVDAAAAAAFCLDELPALSVLNRDVLVAATQGPLDARAVAGEVLKYLDSLAAKGRSFEDLTKAFPGFGHSWAVGWRRIRPLVEGKQVDAAASLLDHVEALPGISDLALARLFQTAAVPLLELPSWMATLQRGRRLAKRLGEPSARNPVVELLRDHAFRRLDDPSARPAAMDVMQALVEIDAGEPTGQRLAGWLAGRLGSADASDADVQVGEFLAASLTSDAAKSSRAITRAALLQRVHAAEPAAAQGLVQRLLNLCPKDAALAGEVAQWFLGRFPTQGAPAPAVGLGEWLCGKLPAGEPREQIRLRTRDVLLKRGPTQADQDESRLWLERVMALAGRDDKAQEGMADWFAAWSAPDTARAEIGEWLVTQVKGSPAEKTRTATRNALEGLVAGAKGYGERIAALERLVELCPDDASFAGRLAVANRAQTMFRLKAAAIGVAVAALAILGAVLGRQN